MVNANISPDVIIAKIKISRCNFDTDPSILAELKHKGVPNDVLMAMVKASYGPPELEKPTVELTNTTKLAGEDRSPKDYTDEQIVAARSAIKALRRLNNATDVGVSYVNYGPLVVDAKTEVGEALIAIPDGPFKTAIQKSMHEYQYAAEIWQKTIRVSAIATKTDLGRYLISEYSIPIKISVWTDIPQSTALSYIWKKADEFFHQAEYEYSSKTK